MKISKHMYILLLWHTGPRRVVGLSPFTLGIFHWCQHLSILTRKSQACQGRDAHKQYLSNACVHRSHLKTWSWWGYISSDSSNRLELVICNLIITPEKSEAERLRPRPEDATLEDAWRHLSTSSCKGKVWKTAGAGQDQNVLKLLLCHGWWLS